MNAYILRAHTDSGMRLIDQVSSIISRETDSRIEVVDHRRPDKEMFGLYEQEVPRKLIHISLDKHLAEYFGIRYFQISRVFNINGNVINRLIGDSSFLKYDETVVYNIIDTDMVHGDTIKIARGIFVPYSVWTIPIVVEENQDLIDMEDLYMDNSLLKNAGGISSCNYMINSRFFSKRTSLPEELYIPIKEIIKWKS